MTKELIDCKFLLVQQVKMQLTGFTLFVIQINAALQSVTLYKSNIMFVKGNKVCADAFKYLKHKEKNFITLSIKGSADDYA